MNKLLQKLKEQEKMLKTSLFGMDEVIRIFSLAKASDLTTLLWGEHGIAKSSLARLWSQSSGLDFRIVTSSEVDETLIAYIDIGLLKTEGKVQMRRGELMERDHLLIDEFFLWTPKYRAKLHQLLEEGTYAGLDVLTKTYTFMTNPIVPEYYAGQIEDVNMATFDRIDVLIPVYQPNVTSTQKMMRKFSQYGKKSPPLESVITWEDYLQIRQEILNVKVPSEIVVWLTLFSESMSCCRHTQSKFTLTKAKLSVLCQECNKKESICARVSCSKPRFLRATTLLSKSLAWYDGRDTLTFEDVITASRYTLPHRLVFISKEENLVDSQKEIQTLVTMFNESMENWRNRDIFNRLEKIIVTSSDENNPMFLDKEANELLVELQEDLPIFNYSKELIEFTKGKVKKGMLKKALALKPTEVEDFRDELDKSGLDAYMKREILETIPTLANALIYKTRFDKSDSKQRAKLVEMIIQVHKANTVPIEPKTQLEDRFRTYIKFKSSLMEIREEAGDIKIVCLSEKLKKEVESMMR